MSYLHHEKILLIEDDEIDALAVKKAFNDNNISNELIHISDSEDALQYLLDHNEADIGMILLDLNMPKMNGVEFLKKRSLSSRIFSIPLFVLTTSNNDSDVRNCYQLGISGYLVKPVNYKKFKSLIHTVYSFWTNCQLP